MFHKINILHVPKTAGTSIRLTLKQHFLYRHFFDYHSHDICFDDLDISSKKRVVIVLRSPVEWYISLYTFKMCSNPDDTIKIYPSMANNSWEDFIADCVTRGNGIEAIRKWFRPWEPYHDRIMQHLCTDEGIYSAFYRFYAGLGTEKISILPHNTGLFVIKMENLESDFNKVVRIVFPFFPKIQFKRENVTPKTALNKSTAMHEKNFLIQQKDSQVFSVLSNVNA